MSVKIIKTKVYRLTCEAMGLKPNEIEHIADEITENCDQWPIMPGMEGAQKARIGLQNKGKRGGARVIYYVAIAERIFFLFAYPKSEQADLTNEQRNAIRAFIRSVKETS